MTRKPKFWVVWELDGRRRAFFVKASSSMDARIRAAMAGLKQVIVEVRELDAKANGQGPRAQRSRGHWDIGKPLMRLARPQLLLLRGRASTHRLRPRWFRPGIARFVEAGLSFISRMPYTAMPA
jgi:hypothetical protein